MDFFTNLIRDIKTIKFASIVGWGIAIWLVILVFGMSQPYPANFMTTTTIFFLFIIIYGFNGEINRLKKELKERDEQIHSLLKEKYKPNS